MFELNGIEATSSEAKDFRIYLDNSRIRRYVVDGPGVLFVDVKDAEPTRLLQYVQDGVNRAYVDLKPLSNPHDQTQTIGMRLDQQLKSGEGVTRIEPYWSTYGLSWAVRHQKPSPTLPEGVPIPDSR